MKLDLHCIEPRLVALYDIENPHGNDADFFIQLAADLDAKAILDLRCSTGLLTRALVDQLVGLLGLTPPLLRSLMLNNNPALISLNGQQGIPQFWVRQQLISC